MIQVLLRRNESQESLYKRFKKKVLKSGILTTCKENEFHQSKGEKRREEKRKSIRNILKQKRKNDKKDTSLVK